MAKKVRITAQSTVRYSQVIVISDEDWAEYQRMIDADVPPRDSEFARRFGDLIEPSDVLDTDDYEDLTMDLVPDEVSS